MTPNIFLADFWALDIEGKLATETPAPIAPTKMTYTPVKVLY
jgi:hypothetical protein